MAVDFGRISMSHSVPAIYDNDVLCPLQPLPLREQEIVSLVVERATTSDADDAQHRQTALERMLEETAALPPVAPADGSSNRDHDRLLYGST